MSQAGKYVRTVARLYGQEAADRVTAYYKFGGKMPAELEAVLQSKQPRVYEDAHNPRQPRSALTRPKGLSRLWKPKPGGTL